jgi:hypothetical protein
MSLYKETPIWNNLLAGLRVTAGTDIRVGVFRVAFRKKNQHAGPHSSSLA